MALCDLKNFSVILLALSIAPPVLSNKVYVHPNDSSTCPGEPCLTLIEYARNVPGYFTPGTEVIFVNGDHLLNVSLNLDYLTNITFTGNKAKILLDRLASIFIGYTENITLNFLQLESEITRFIGDNIYYLKITYSSSVIITNVLFKGINNIERKTIETINSNVKFANCSFFNIYGSIIEAGNESDIGFSGNNFTNNMVGDDSVGLVEVSSSAATFNGDIFYQNIAFDRNIRSIVYTKSSSVDFSGLTIFKENNMCIQLTDSSMVQINGIAIFDRNLAAIDASLSHLELDGDVTFSNHNEGVIRLSDASMNCIGEVTFKNNMITNSSVVYAHRSNLFFLGITNFDSNSALNANEGALRGTVYISSSSVEFSSLTTFKENDLCIQMTDSSIVQINGTAVFENNSAAIDAGSLSQLELNGDVTFSKHNEGVVHLFDASMKCIGEITFSNNLITNSSAVHAQMSNLSFSGITNFVSNSALNANGGALYALDSVVVLGGTMEFFNNRAEGGYGGAFFINGSKLQTDGIIRFENNTARNSLRSHINTNGGALYAFNSDVVLKGSIDFLNNWAQEGFGGAIFTFSSSMQTEGNCSFLGNSAQSRGGVIYVVHSDIQLSGNIQFERNKAQSGGAIAFDNSTLTLLGPVTVDFIKNEAEKGGGALFLLDQDSLTLCDSELSLYSTEDCFFRLPNFNETNRNVQLNFKGNVAGNGGTVLYGGGLDECTVSISGTSKNGSATFQDISNITPNENDHSSDITSNAREICFCVNETTPDCSLIYPEENITVVRGRYFNLSVVLVGQGGAPVSSTVRAYIDNNDNLTKLDPASHDTDTVQATCSKIRFTMLSNDTSKTLVLHPDEGPCFSSNTAKKRVQIDFKNCPPGFVLNNSECICEKRLRDVNSKCDIDTEMIERPNDAWINPTWDEDENYTGFTLSRYCPLNYCNKSIKELNFAFSDDENASDIQCDENRSGTLCGNCKDEYSLTLSQFKCEECGNEYISLLVLFALSGVMLIVILTGLHMTVAAGTINGLILYANIIGANSERFFSHKFNVFAVFISWLNLDFGFNFCFFNGLDFYTYVWLQYAFPIYLWFLMGIIILSSRRSAIMMKLLGSNPIAVLATLILLSYTKLLQNIIAALSYTDLEFANGTSTSVWLFNGNVEYLKGNHLILAIFSLFISVFFFLPFTFFLMFGYYLLAFSDRRCFTWLNRFKPLLDAFYGPYQKEVRFWTGFMLLLRFCLYLTFALRKSGDNSTDLLAILTAFSIVISFAWLSRQGIYEKLYLDLLEASFVLNICLLTTVTYYYDTEGSANDNLTYVSVGIAMAEFIGIVVFHIFCQILRCPCAKHLKETVLKHYNANGDENLPLRNNEFVHTREAFDHRDLQVSMVDDQK